MEQCREEELGEVAAGELVRAELDLETVLSACVGHVHDPSVEDQDVEDGLLQKQLSNAVLDRVERGEVHLEEIDVDSGRALGENRLGSRRRSAGEPDGRGRRGMSGEGEDGLLADAAGS